MTGKARSAVALNKQLTDRDRSVLASLSAHRLLSGRQLQRLHFFDAPSEASAARLTRQRMAHLAALGLTVRLERRVGGVRAGSAGSVWRITEAARRVIGAGSSSGRRQRRDYEPGSAYTAHTLACSEVFTCIAEADRERALELLTYQSEPNCWREHGGQFGEPLTLKPDGYVAVACGKIEEHAFIEVDRGTHGRAAIRRKMLRYRDYQRSGSEQQRLGVFPRVIWLTITRQRLAVLRELIEELPADISGSHQATPLDEVVAALLRRPQASSGDRP